MTDAWIRQEHSSHKTRLDGPDASLLRICSENRTQFVEQRLVSVSDADVGQVGLLDVVACDAFLVEIGTDPVLFHLTDAMGEKSISIFNEFEFINL